MAESAAITAVINRAVEIGANLIVETGSRLYRLKVKEDIEWIERQMRHFKSCLKDAESKQGGSHEVANLIIDMRDLALDIEDILDTYHSEIESRKGPFRFVKQFLDILAACIPCYGGTINTFSQEIEVIKSRADKIEVTRERCRINVDTDGGNADMDVWDQRKKFLDATDSIIVGREDIFQELKGKLRSSNSVICVVGEAGVGKTTVCKKIYTDMQNEFTSSALVYVSNEPRVQDLLLDIAKQVGLEKENMNEKLEDNLCSLLSEKRCLIFLDDIWTTEAWDELKNAIPINSRNGSRIIITSRYTRVGRYIDGERSLIELKLLDQEKSRELFSELMKSSSENTNERFPPIELEDIAKKIVERCGGLPLAILVAVGMLKQRRRNKLDWNEVLDRFSTSAENSCLKALSLSYKDLPQDLRHFFLYFGLFPEDKEIYAYNLFKAWVTEKLIQDDGTRDPDDIGAAILETLQDRNLIQVSKRTLDGRVFSCRIHDLLRALCIETAKENNFFCTCRYIHSNSFSTLRRLTIDNTSQYSFSNSITPKLRTLFCFSNSTGIVRSLIPNEIGNLSSLTYLKLSGRFESMPSTIRNLKKLVTLDIGDASFWGRLPRTIFRMMYLKHLLVGDGKEFEPNTCTYLNVKNEVYLPNIETLVGLNTLLSNFKASSLQKLSNLRELSLIDINYQHMNVISGKTPISEKLQNLALLLFPRVTRLDLSHYDHLVRLILYRSYGNPPETIEFPPNLIYLTLGGVMITEDSMRVLKKLPRLEILCLAWCKYDEAIALDFSGANSFPELQVLEIQEDKSFEIPELIVDQTGMPKLYKFVCHTKDLNVPERLREIMVEDRDQTSIEPFIMPPKKKSKASASSSSFYDEAKFVSVEAEERYHNLVVHKNCIPERGFNDLEGPMQRLIERRNWEALTRQPPPALIPVVREFYANAKEHRNLRIVVRGKWIRFDRSSINRYYGLPDIDDDDYSSLRDSGSVDPDDIIRELAIPDVTWKRAGAELTNFPAAGMYPNCKAWHYFICGKILPSSNISEVTKERALLNFTIHRGLSIDVGMVIQTNFLRALKGSTTAGLGYPSLIYELCRLGGIDSSPNEEIVHPKPPITKKVIWQFTSKVPPRAIEGQSSQPQAAEGRSSQPSEPHHTTSPTDDITGRIEALQLQLTERYDQLEARNQERYQGFQHQIDHMQASMTDQYHQLQNSMQTQFQYQNDFFSVLASAYPNMVFPPPPSFPYPPPTQGPSHQGDDDDEQ